MKISDGFDARRLRPKGPSNWRFRIGAGFAALLATLGVLLAMAGAASLLGRPAALGELNGGRPVGTAAGRLALAPLPPSRPPIPGAGHGSAPDEKARLIPPSDVLSRPIPPELGKLAGLRGG
jgi:hypothetical protein